MNIETLTSWKTIGCVFGAAIALSLVMGAINRISGVDPDKPEVVKISSGTYKCTDDPSSMTHSFQRYGGATLNDLLSAAKIECKMRYGGEPYGYSYDK